MPFNITAAAHKIKGVTLMPTFGLNVYSMLKHSTLVLTTKSLEKIEENLLLHMHNNETRNTVLSKKAH
jgi:large subunit ribosomal protein L4